MTMTSEMSDDPARTGPPLSGDSSSSPKAYRNDDDASRKNDGSNNKSSSSSSSGSSRDGAASGFPVPLRILCLHDAHSNAETLKDSLEICGQRLYEKHGIDLVYVNSPLVEPEMENTALDEDSGRQEPAKRVWWEVPEPEQRETRSPSAKDCTTRENDSAENVGAENRFSNENHHPQQQEQEQQQPYQPQQQYLGLDASLLMLRQIWTSSPYWGILGVGQGAAVASLLALMPFQERTIPRPSVCIFVNGLSILEEEESLVDETITTSMHLVDVDSDANEDNNGNENAAFSSADASNNYERLIRQFGGKVHTRSKPLASSSTAAKDSRNTLRKADWNAIGKFLIDQKKLRFHSRDLRHSHERQIVALQTALHCAEQKAAAKIAAEIAENPPPALMAVIRPQDVGGWSGKKRREFGEEGGGAPCPSEFLLRREKRQTNQDSASRVHPSQQQQQNSGQRQQQEEPEEIER